MRPTESKPCAMTIETEMITKAIFFYSNFQNKNKTRDPGQHHNQRKMSCDPASAGLLLLAVCHECFSNLN